MCMVMLVWLVYARLPAQLIVVCAVHPYMVHVCMVGDLPMVVVCRSEHVCAWQGHAIRNNPEPGSVYL